MKINKYVVPLGSLTMPSTAAFDVLICTLELFFFNVRDTVQKNCRNRVLQILFRLGQLACIRVEGCFVSLYELRKSFGDRNGGISRPCI